MRKESIRNMGWLNKDSITPIRLMSDRHILHVISFIHKNTSKTSYGEYSKGMWLLALDSELKYRKRMINYIVNHFPPLKQVIKTYSKPYR